MVTKKASKPKAKMAARRRKGQTVGESIIEGLKQAIAWTRGENDNVRVTLVQVPEADVRKVRTKMGLSQAQFATKFGFPAGHASKLGTGPVAAGCSDARASRGDRKHPEAVEDVLRKAS